MYPTIGVAMEMVSLYDIGVYIDRYQNMIAQYIATRYIMDFFLASERNPGLKISRRWLEKPSLDILGIREGHAAAEGGWGRGGLYSNSMER